MKISIYNLLGMIKDGKAPKKIMYDNQIWKYNERDGYAYDGTYWKSKEYKNIENGDNLFDEYVITDILNDEVEILETTITLDGKEINLDELKPAFNNCPVGEKGESVFDKIEDCNKIEKIEKTVIVNCMTIGAQICANKINEIIDKIIDKINGE